MDDEDLLLLILTMMMLLECYHRYMRGTSRRRFWVRPLYQSRDVDGMFAATFEHMYMEDSEQFQTNLRMNASTFDFLLSIIKNDIKKSSYRPAISPKCRLYLTLLYLAHGGSVRHFSLSFKMGASTVRVIIKETCEVLWNKLGPIYLSLPNKNEWKRIANDFELMWNLPHCVGAIDGKHVNIVCPPNSNSQFYNYKGNFSIVLLAACDANYTFTAVDIGAYGSQSDGGVLCHSEFGKQLFQNELDLPSSNWLRNTDINFPYYFVGDAAFPLKENLMRPYPGILLPADREIFNKRLSRARRTIENAFGILCTRWRVLLSPIHMFPENAESVVKAAVVLHNFVKMHDGTYCPPNFTDSFDGEEVVAGLWRQDTTPLQSVRRISSNNASRNAYGLRDTLKEYLMNNPI